MIGQSETGSSNQTIFNSSLGDAQLCCAFYPPQKSVQNARAKTILLSQPVYIEHRWGCSKA